MIRAALNLLIAKTVPNTSIRCESFLNCISRAIAQANTPDFPSPQLEVKCQQTHTHPPLSGPPNAHRSVVKLTWSV